jgi:hypothetical protein
MKLLAAAYSAFVATSATKAGSCGYPAKENQSSFVTIPAKYGFPNPGTLSEGFENGTEFEVHY